MNPRGFRMENGMAQAVPAASSLRDMRGLADAFGVVAGVARRGWNKARSKAQVAGEERMDAERLRDAFHAFEGAANRLEGSYALLRDRVEQLTAQLAQANGELELQLREKQALAERQAALLSALPAGVVVVDAEGTVREANPAAMKLLGATLVGDTWQRAQQRLTPADGVLEWLTPGQAPRRIGLEEQSMGPDRGRILLLHDVTEAHAARERLERNERLAHMGQMAARLAHQLRTPLATAMLYADRLDRGGIGEKERADIGQRILARLRNLERVTREMLRFVSGERAPGKQVGVGALLAEAGEVMTPLMAARGIAFTCEDMTCGAVLHGDQRGLSAALLSLLENAAQATAQGGKVHIDGMANSARVRIRVRDSGSGILPHALQRLFEPFYSTRSDGTGLGLAIVKSVVEAHGGSIEVTSAENAGTCFTMTLPCSRQMPPAVMGDAPGSRRHAVPMQAPAALEREAA
jgi:two-component system, sensor histidine kinase FlrB